jgi:hypothetical protein
MSFLLKSNKNVAKILPLTGWLNCKSLSQLPKMSSKPEGTIDAVTNVLASPGMADVANKTG